MSVTYSLKELASDNISKDSFIDYYERCHALGLPVCSDAVFYVNNTKHILIDFEDIKESHVKIPSFVDAVMTTDTSLHMNRYVRELDLNNVTSLSHFALYHYDCLRSVEAPKLDSIGAEAFRGTKVESLYLPNVTYIGEKAFYFCTRLLELNAPKVKATGTEWLRFCNNIQRVIMPNIEVLGYLGDMYTKELSVEFNSHFKCYRQNTAFIDINTGRIFNWYGSELEKSYLSEWSIHYYYKPVIELGDSKIYTDKHGSYAII
jgi:hypothetical protein